MVFRSVDVTGPVAFTLAEEVSASANTGTAVLPAGAEVTNAVTVR